MTDKLIVRAETLSGDHGVHDNGLTRSAAAFPPVSHLKGEYPQAPPHWFTLWEAEFTTI